MFQALIFDFDGLILDTELPEFQAWQEVYEAHGSNLPLSEWVVCVGTAPQAFDPYEYLETLLNRPIDRDAVRTQHRQRAMELIHAQPVMPGVEKYLADAKRLGLKLGVASASSCDWVTGHLSRLGLLDQFDCIKGADDVEQVKPHPDLYLAAANALGVPAPSAVALEDSPNGILAASRAGLACVAVPNAITRQLTFDHVDVCLNSLTEMPLEQLLTEAAQRRKT